MSTTSSVTTPTGSNTLNQADFMKLLVTQMTSQDPLSPQSDTEFAAQLAQFTALQTAQTTQGNIATLQASQLLGASVTVAPGGTNPNITDTVSQVQMNAGTPYIVLKSEPGVAFSLSQIVDIQQNTRTGTTPASGQ